MDDLNSQAKSLADLYNSCANDLRSYRSDHFDALTPEERAELDDEVYQFEDLHDRFAAKEIADCLAKVKSQLNDIQTVTQQARAVVKELTHAQQVIRIVTCVLAVASAAAAGDYLGVGEQLGKTAESLLSGKDTSKDVAAASGGPATS